MNDVAFTTDGTLLAAGRRLPGRSRRGALWNVSDGTLARPFEGHNDAIYSVALSPDGTRSPPAATTRRSCSGTCADGKELRDAEGHNGASSTLAFRPDGKVLASASADRTVKLWDVATGTRLDTFSEPLKEQYSRRLQPRRHARRRRAAWTTASASGRSAPPRRKGPTAARVQVRPRRGDPAAELVSPTARRCSRPGRRPDGEALGRGRT